MRIVHVVPSFGFGGMEKVICALIEATASQHEHTVLSLDGSTAAAAWVENTNTEVLKFKQVRSRRSFFRSLHKALRMSRPDVLMTYNWGATDAIWLGRLAGIRNIFHNEHGFSVEEGKTTLWLRDCIRFLVYRLSTKVIVVSHELESMLGARFSLTEDRIRRIPNGIDISHYSPDDDERQGVRASLGFGEIERVIGFSGRLDAVKNLDLLLDIFQACKPNDFPFRLLIVGDGPERLRLQGRCRVMGLESYVTFLGARPEVLPFLRAMDVFLLTSLREQMPLTVLEAMAVGIPVVATRVGELPYIIEDGFNGFLRDVNACPEQFVEVLRSLSYISTYRRVAEAARNTIAQNFPINAMVRQYCDLMREVDSLGTDSN